MEDHPHDSDTAPAPIVPFVPTSPYRKSDDTYQGYIGTSPYHIPLAGLHGQHMTDNPLFNSPDIPNSHPTHHHHHHLAAPHFSSSSASSTHLPTSIPHLHAPLSPSAAGRSYSPIVPSPRPSHWDMIADGAVHPGAGGYHDQNLHPFAVQSLNMVSQWRSPAICTCDDQPQSRQSMPHAHYASGLTIAASHLPPMPTSGSPQHPSLPHSISHYTVPMMAYRQSPSRLPATFGQRDTVKERVIAARFQSDLRHPFGLEAGFLPFPVDPSTTDHSTHPLSSSKGYTVSGAAGYRYSSPAPPSKLVSAPDVRSRHMTPPASWRTSTPRATTLRYSSPPASVHRLMPGQAASPTQISIIKTGIHQPGAPPAASTGDSPPQLSTHHLHQAYWSFSVMDDDEDDKISATDIVTFLNQHGQPTKLADIEELIALADRNGTGNLTFSGFIRLLTYMQTNDMWKETGLTLLSAGAHPKETSSSSPSSSLPPDLLQAVEAARTQFCSMDTDHDGRLTAFDYACYVSRTTGNAIPIAEAYHVMKETNPDCVASLDFNGYLRMISLLKNANEIRQSYRAPGPPWVSHSDTTVVTTLAELEQQFRKTDQDHDGYLSAVECAAALAEAGYPSTSKDVMEAMLRVPLHNASLLDLPGFLQVHAILHSNPCPSPPVVTVLPPKAGTPPPCSPSPVPLATQHNVIPPESVISSQGYATPRKEDSISFKGSDTSIKGYDTPAKGYVTTVKGYNTPVKGTDTPVSHPESDKFPKSDATFSDHVSTAPSFSQTTKQEKLRCELIGVQERAAELKQMLLQVNHDIERLKKEHLDLESSSQSSSTTSKHTRTSQDS